MIIYEESIKKQAISRTVWHIYIPEVGYTQIVTGGPIVRKLKSSGPEHGKQKKQKGHSKLTENKKKVVKNN